MLIWKIVAGVITTRLLFLGLGDVGYGFWILLWSVFGYSLLLDFGFGTSVQKYAAELSAKENYKLFNKQLSTILGSYSAMSVIIILLSAIAAYFLSSIFSIENHNVEFYQKVFFVFGIGCGLLFPLGAFAEVLKGIGKIHIRNIIELISVTINLIGIYYLMENNYSVLELTIFALSLNLLTNISMVILTYYYLPQLNISIKNFDFSYLKEIISFSFFAYLIMFANMIIYKTDQILVGIMLGMAPVALYQIGSRLPDLLNKFANQFQNNLAPIAAKFNHTGELQRLKTIMFQSNRIVMLGTTLLFIMLIFLTKPILFIWLEITNQEVILISYIMLLSVYLLIIFRSVNSKILLMTGYHKFLSKIAIYESIANVIASILLIKYLGVVGVALGTIIPNFIISVFIIFPLAVKFSEYSIVKYIKEIFLSTLLIAIIPSIILYTSLVFINDWSFLKIVLIGALTSFVYLIFSYLFYLNKEEKNRIKNSKIFSKFNK